MDGVGHGEKGRSIRTWDKGTDTKILFFKTSTSSKHTSSFLLNVANNEKKSPLREQPSVPPNPKIDSNFENE
jgi:hypothetical protein